MLRIAYLIDGLGMGGAERLMVPLLAHLDRGQFASRVGVLQTKENNPLAEDIRRLGVPVDEIPVRRLRDPSALPRLRAYLAAHQINLVHTQLEFANILGNLAAKTLHLPSVATVHVLPSDEARLKARLHQWTEWAFLYLFCDRVLTVSEETRRSFIRHSRFPAQRVQTLYNGIDLAQIPLVPSDRLSVRQELGIPQEAQLLVTVAILRPLKGIHLMLQALPTILEKHPHTFYLIVGDGPQRSQLEEQARALGIAARVIFTGMRRDIPRLLNSSDLFVLPSLSEALPTVLAEAMAAKLPIVASAVGGIPEMLIPGENGMLVPPPSPQGFADACSTLLDDASRRKQMGTRGREIVEQTFNITIQVQKLAQIYHEESRRYGK